jgi:hypothetical protein
LKKISGKNRGEKEKKIEKNLLVPKAPPPDITRLELPVYSNLLSFWICSAIFLKNIKNKTENNHHERS